MSLDQTVAWWLANPIYLGVVISFAAAVGYWVALVVWKRGKKPKATADPVEEKSVEVDVAPHKVKYEIIRPKDNGDVIIKSGMIPKTQEVLFWRGAKPLPRAYFVNHIIKRTKKVKGFFGKAKEVAEYVVKWNAYWGEALDEDNPKVPAASDELSNLLLSDDIIQMRNGVVQLAKFVLDEQLVKLLVIFFLIAIPFGLIMDTILGLIPTQVVTWIP